MEIGQVIMGNESHMMMEDKKILKNNKLIAEFMGFKNHGAYHETVDYEEGLPMAGWKQRANELCFHTSWDCLMPVVEKIDTLSYHHCGGTDLTYRFYWIKPYAKIIKHATIIAEDNHPVMMTAIYNMVVKFIKWYNDEETRKRKIKARKGDNGSGEKRPV